MKRACFLLLVLMLSISALAQTEGAWLTRAALPTARQEMPGALFNGKIYVAGGIGLGSLATLEIYDIATDSWNSGELMPDVRHHHATASMNGKVYVFGGYESIFFDAQDETFEYDPVSDSWTEKTRMPQLAGANVAVALGAYIYVIGGANGNTALDVNFRYDAAADQWDLLAPMPTPREHHAAAVIDSLIYVVGGRGSPDAPTRLEAYNPATDTWTILADMPTARSGLNAVAVNGKLYVMGGEGGGIHGEFEEYNPATNQWTSLPQMITPRHGIAAVADENVIYVIGGGSAEGYAPSAAHEAFVISAPNGMNETPACDVITDFHVTNDWIEFNAANCYTGKMALRIIDLQGKVISSHDFAMAPDRNRVRHHVNGLLDGIYICEIQTEKGAFLRKFLLTE